jgi:hypothetical protein
MQPPWRQQQQQQQQQQSAVSCQWLACHWSQPWQV